MTMARTPSGASPTPENKVGGLRRIKKPRIAAGLFYRRPKLTKPASSPCLYLDLGPVGPVVDPGWASADPAHAFPVGPDFPVHPDPYCPDSCDLPLSSLLFSQSLHNLEPLFFPHAASNRKLLRDFQSSRSHQQQLRRRPHPCEAKSL